MTDKDGLTCMHCEHCWDYDGPMCMEDHADEIHHEYETSKCKHFKERRRYYRVQYWIWKGGTHNVYYFHDYDEARCCYMKWLMTQVFETKHVENVCFQTWCGRHDRYETIYDSYQYHPD